MQSTPKHIIGSVSSGTMREDALAPRFISTVRHFDAAKADALQSEWDELVDDGDDEAKCEFVHGLFDTLNEFAPPWFYFGAHPGDGADYGFWLCEEFGSEFDGLKVGDLSEVPAGYEGEVAVVNDHGNVSLYTVAGGTSTEVWSVV